jgi:hypothetical protein
MLDMLRLVSSEDIGHDEASVQSLVKKHKVFQHPTGNCEISNRDAFPFDT